MKYFENCTIHTVIWSDPSKTLVIVDYTNELSERVSEGLSASKYIPKYIELLALIGNEEVVDEFTQNDQIAQKEFLLSVNEYAKDVNLIKSQAADVRENVKAEIRDEVKEELRQELVKDDLRKKSDKEPEMMSKTVEVQVAAPLTLDRLTKDFTTEELFKLKLEIFEMPDVGEKAPREVKSTLRKSKTPLELFSYYHTYMTTPSSKKPKAKAKKTATKKSAV